MTMRRVLIVLVLGLLGLVIAPTAQARLSAKHICKVHRCTTIAATHEVRVFDALTKLPERGQPYDAQFVEWLPTHKLTMLAAHNPEAVVGECCEVDAARISGRYVAYELPALNAGSTSPCCYEAEVRRINTTTGEVTRTVRLFSYREGLSISWFGVTAQGSVAWVARDEEKASNGISYPLTTAIYVLLANTDTTVELARSSEIDPHSVALIPGHLYWLEAGVPRTYAAR
jgi:hypothetical protein